MERCEPRERQRAGIPRGECAVERRRRFIRYESKDVVAVAHVGIRAIEHALHLVEISRARLKNLERIAKPDRRSSLPGGCRGKIKCDKRRHVTRQELAPLADVT